MNRLFHTLRGIVDRSGAQPRADAAPSPGEEALPGFDNRIEVLSSYAERSAAYEDDLLAHLDQIIDQLAQLQEYMESAIDNGADRDALEYLRLAVRLRPQRDLLEQELKAFHVVAAELIQRVNTLMQYLDEARSFAYDATLSPAATYYLDFTLNRLTRYFVMLERVTKVRHQTLPDRLAQQITVVIDDRKLDLELATYILSRRRSLGSGRDAQV
jgi:hypothetical protein